MPRSRSSGSGGGSRRSKKARGGPRKPQVEVSQPSIGVEEVRTLCRQMAEDPSLEAALHLEIRSRELEGFFAAIRERAERYRRSVQEGKRAEQETRETLAALGKSFEPQPGDEQPAKGEMVSSPPSYRFEELIAGRGEELDFTSILRKEPAVQPDATPGDAGGGFDLKYFFSNVSNAVVNAQQALNQTSLRYARQLEGTAIPPTLYSIPNVKAEIKLALSATSGGGIKAFFGGTTTTTQSQSTISFDVAASPPPPGNIGNFGSPIPPFLPVSGPDRDLALTPIRALAARPAFMQDDDWERRAVVLWDVSNGLGNTFEWFALVLVPAPPLQTASPPPDQNSVDIAIFAVDSGQATLATISGATLTGSADTVRQSLVHTALSIAAWVDSIRIAPG